MAARSAKTKEIYDKVNHGEEWDIKRSNVWKSTLGITYPGSVEASVVYEDGITTPEELGNFLYGYAGAAAKINENLLIAGSVFASGIWKKDATYEAKIGERLDQVSIRKGVSYYHYGN